MRQLRYSNAALYGDYLRAGLGGALTAGPLLLLDVATPVAVLLGGLAVLFAWFGLRTGLRQLSWVELSGEAIARRGPFGRRLPWNELRKVKLAYYAPKRARGRGWLQLTLRGAGSSAIRLDSTLDGFDEVLAQTHAAVAARDLPLDEATASNFAALGVRAGAPDGAFGAPDPGRPGGGP